jgi:murein DD-endopeptidase MepM/ murein hydrolase activator NlpD
MMVVAVGGLVALWQLEIFRMPISSSGPSEEEILLSTLFELARGLDPKALEMTIAELDDPNVRDEEGRTPLMVAAAEGSLASVRVLVKAGANLDTTTTHGQTALMFASQSASTARIPLLLLNAGADPTLTNSEGKSAFDLGAENAMVRNSGLYRRLGELADQPFDRNWPSGYVVPVEGATVSSRPSHLPGAPRAYRNGTHEGFDFYNGTVGVAIAYGTPVRAVAWGVVVRADLQYKEPEQEVYDETLRLARESLDSQVVVLDRLRGRQVWLRHAGGFISRYAHLSGIPSTNVVGQEIAQGQIIGQTGNSGTLEAVQGTRDGPHPHVELWNGDDYLGRDLEAEEIYKLARQVFGKASLPLSFE